MPARPHSPRSPRRAQWILLGGTLLLYGLLSCYRPELAPSVWRDSLPSLLFFPAAFSLVGLAPRFLGGAGGDAIQKRTWIAGTLVGIALIEGIAPALGRGTSDLIDAFALALGAGIYAIAVGGD